MNKKISVIVNKFKNVENPLIMILHELEDEFGYLSYEMMDILSKKLSISLNEIYSVASFYKDFKLERSGKYQIKVCLGTVCYINGGPEIVNEIKRLLNIENGECTKDFKFSLDTSRCLGCCSMAPVMAINDKIYGNVKVSDIKRILSEYDNE